MIAIISCRVGGSLNPFNQTLWQPQARAQQPLAARHLAMVGFVVVAGQVK